MFFNDEKGYALLLTLVVVIILTIILSSVLFLINNEIHITKFQENRTKAFYLAEAGLEFAVNIIMNNEWKERVDEFGDLLTGQPGHLGHLSSYFVGGDLTNVNINFIDSDNLFEISSTAEARGISVNLKIDLIREIVESAIIAQGDVNISNGAKVYGNIMIYDENNDNTFTNSGIISGEIINIDNFDAYILPVLDSFIPEDGTLIIGEQYTISEDGEYESIEVSNSTLNIDLGGGVRAIRVRNLIIENGAIILKGDGKLELYVEDVFNLNGKFNKNGDSQKLSVYFYGSGTEQTINISHGSEFVGFIFAPDADVVVYGGGSFSGSIICNSIELNSGSEGEYDGGSEPSDLDLIFQGANKYKIIWKELDRDEGL